MQSKSGDRANPRTVATLKPTKIKIRGQQNPGTKIRGPKSGDRKSGDRKIRGQKIRGQKIRGQYTN